MLAPDGVSLSSDQGLDFLSFQLQQLRVPSGLARNGPGPAPQPQVLSVSLFTFSSWTNFQTWIKNKANRNRHTHEQR